MALTVLSLLVLAGGVLTAADGSSAVKNDEDAKVHDKRQLENEWASTSKRDHKVSDA